MAKFLDATGLTYLWSKIKGTFAAKAITLSGYGITDAKIDSGTITLGTSTITPATHTASTAVGEATKGVYIASDGTATAMSYSVSKDVPSDAVFTDHTYTASTGVSLTNGAFSTSKSESVITNTSGYAANATVTVPSYIVGLNQVNLYLNGVKCRRGSTFAEVGDAGSSSTTIKLLDAIPSGYEIEVVVG